MTSRPEANPFLDQIRERLGDRYEISRELLGGGMSRVFVAREIALDRQVVIKFLPTEVAAGANRDRFRREIQMAARLSHPHIAPLFAAAEEGELLYFTMPYIAGESLRHALDSGRRFSLQETLDILRDIAAALTYAHRAGVVHRDIKPANVLMEGDHAVVTDFGVAKALGFALGIDSRASAATVSGIAIGTPAYMAPEQIAGDAAADHRVDIYAFGLLGYELLTGHAPFRAESPQALLAAQLTHEPPPLLAARPDVSPVLAALLRRCLEKDAAARPQSADSVLEVLRAVRAASGDTQPAYRPPAGNRGKLIAAAFGVVVVAGVLWAASERHSSADRSTVSTRPDSGAMKVVTATPAVVPASPVVPIDPDKARASERANELQNAQREQRLIGLLRDSIANAVHRSVSDSITLVRLAEQQAQHARDSIALASRPTFGVPGLDKIRVMMTPEMFTQRAGNMGPPRRVGISINSVVRSPTLVLAAGALRDSLRSRVQSRPHLSLVPADSVTLALARSRTLDSLRTWLNTDMWITIYANGDPRSDSLAWSVTLRDFTAHSTYTTQGVSSRRISAANASDPAIMSQLAQQTIRLLDAMDRAPRRDQSGAPGRRPTEVRAPE